MASLTYRASRATMQGMGAWIAAAVLLLVAALIALYARQRAARPRHTLVAAVGIAACAVSVLIPEPASSVLALIGIASVIPVVISRIRDRGPV